MTIVAENSSDFVVYELNPIEGSQATFKKLQYSCVYSCKHQSEATAAVVLENITHSFTRLIELYPILVGHRVQDSDKNLIVVSPADRARQRIYQHEEKLVAVCDFLNVKYRRNLWPPKIKELLNSQARDTDCLLSASIVQLKDGFMVALSVSHVITDAAGVVILLQQWSSLALQLPKDNSDASKNLQPNFPVDFDHMKFWRNLKQYPSAAHPFAQYVNKQEIGSVDEVNATLANFYKNGSIGKGELETYMLCVSASNIARISAQFNSFDKRPLHGVQILYALIWQRFLAAVIQNNPVDLNEPAHLNFLHNIRSLVSSPYYVGNGVSTACIVSTIDKVISMQTIDLAYKIKMHLNSLTPGAVVHLAESVIDPKNMFMQKAVYISSKAASILSLSNASKMPFYDIDFGLGRPETVLCSTLPTENMLSWLPSEDGGVVINAGIRKDLYLRLKQDKILNEFIDFAN